MPTYRGPKRANASKFSRRDDNSFFRTVSLCSLALSLCTVVLLLVLFLRNPKAGSASESSNVGHQHGAKSLRSTTPHLGERLSASASSLWSSLLVTIGAAPPSPAFRPLPPGSVVERGDLCVSAENLEVRDPPMSLSYFKSGIDCYTDGPRPGAEQLVANTFAYSYCLAWTDESGLRRFGGNDTAGAYHLLSSLDLAKARPRLCTSSGCNCPYLDLCAGISTEPREGVCFKTRYAEQRKDLERGPQGVSK